MKSIYIWLNDGNMMAHDTLCYGTLQSKEAIRLTMLNKIEATTMVDNVKA